ncbi:unnamed protein product [Acanthoscelides obtectus]|uniref:Uncharacterized protein n=1 Tax=Acanthoscelides obtectus TaxID=200917 RepID=A0A9P0L5R0_ACAOB|nr:unnamed protein product [Acanthoscelides obtectus]CAK1681053.1 hypothetical protein AOBTE_LOCUS32997 [Acanthoscelides obtectus]
MKLKKLRPDQRRFAEKIINDVLFEAEMRTLTRDGVRFVSHLLWTPSPSSSSPSQTTYHNYPMSSNLPYNMPSAQTNYSASSSGTPTPNGTFPATPIEENSKETNAAEFISNFSSM